MPRSRRTPTHAGSWYSKDADELAKEISGWLTAVPQSDEPSPRALIAPHAGYRYSGHVMAHAYRHIRAEEVSRVFLLGPSHHVYAQTCLLSNAEAYDTPFGPVEIDRSVYTALLSTGAFERMSQEVDEAEHSLELHLPYIAHVMRGSSFKLVPIMVGAINPDREASFGRLLAPYLNERSNLFIISSDFCHWGSRFNFTPYDKAQGAIHESIRWLDLKGIRTITEGSAEAFNTYMLRYSNTVCGRHPIAVLLHMLASAKLPARIELRKYDQSSKCTQPGDSSVSYAAITFNPLS